MAAKEVIKTVGNPIMESGNQYIISQGPDKLSKHITNFVMEPLNSIESDDGNKIKIRFIFPDGTDKICILDSVCFSSTQKFKQVLKNTVAVEAIYNGTENDLSNIQEYMYNKYRGYNKSIGINYVGLHKLGEDWCYIGMDQSIDKKGNNLLKIVSVVEDNDCLKSGIIACKMISKEKLKVISKDLFHFNSYERTVNIIGWTCGCFIKERMRQHRIKYSHLVIAGGAGSGKSETVEKIIQPVFSMNGSGIGCGSLTKFSVLKDVSSTNLIPLIFEEYKPHRMSKANIDLLSDTMRSSYDGQINQRGRMDQSVVSYMRRSPIIVVGESGFDESAIKERSIEIQFAKSDRTLEHTMCYQSLSAHEKELNELGKALLQMSMNIPDEDLDKMIQKSRVFDKLKFGTRVILGLSNVYLGIILLQNLYEAYHLDFWELTGITKELVCTSIIGNMQNSLDGGEKVHTAVDVVLQTMDTMAMKRCILNKFDFIVDVENNELCLQVKLLYDNFRKYVKDCNLQDVEVLGINQFVRQLKKEPYYKGNYSRDFMERGNGEDNGLIRHKCHVLWLDKVMDACGDLEVFTKLDGAKVDEEGFMVVTEAEQQRLPFADGNCPVTWEGDAGKNHDKECVDR